jgi:hypothetical protein
VFLLLNVFSKIYFLFECSSSDGEFHLQKIHHHQWHNILDKFLFLQLHQVDPVFQAIQEIHRFQDFQVGQVVLFNYFFK